MTALLEALKTDTDAHLGTVWNRYFGILEQTDAIEQPAERVRAMRELGMDAIKAELKINDEFIATDVAARAQHAQHARQRPSQAQRDETRQRLAARIVAAQDKQRAILHAIVDELRPVDLYPVYNRLGGNVDGFERAAQEAHLAELDLRNALTADDQHAAAMEHLVRQRPRAFGRAS